MKIALDCTSKTRGSRLSPIKTKTCKAGEDSSKSGLERLMWSVACKCRRISLRLSGWREATALITSAFPGYLVAILKESCFQWFITHFGCFSLFYSSLALTSESVNNHSNKRGWVVLSCTLLYTTDTLCMCFKTRLAWSASDCIGVTYTHLQSVICWRSRSTANSAQMVLPLPVGAPIRTFSSEL